MGCIWSSEPDPLRPWLARNQQRGVVPQSRQRVARNQVHGVIPQPKTGINEPQFGEFYCRLCGRKWKSLRCWPNKYQMCKRCKKPVYPHNCRDLYSADFTSSVEDSKEHEMNLCQMCQQLGHSCKEFGKNYKNRSGIKYKKTC